MLRPTNLFKWKRNGCYISGYVGAEPIWNVKRVLLQSWVSDDQSERVWKAVPFDEDDLTNEEAKTLHSGGFIVDDGARSGSDDQPGSAQSASAGRAEP